MLTRNTDMITKRPPFSFVSPLDEFFNDILRGDSHLPRGVTSTIAENEAIIAFDLPGVKPSDVEVSVVGSELTVTYLPRNAAAKKTLSYVIVDEYDGEATTAKLEHGVLELRIPRAARTRGKKVTIEVK